MKDLLQPSSAAMRKDDDKEDGMVSRVIPVEDFDLVIFGATGDLAQRKILPSLWRRFADGQMPPEARVIGAARSPLSAEAFRAQIAVATGR